MSKDVFWYNFEFEELLNPMNRTVDEFNANEHAERYHMVKNEIQLLFYAIVIYP